MPMKKLANTGSSSLQQPALIWYAMTFLQQCSSGQPRGVSMHRQGRRSCVTVGDSNLSIALIPPIGTDLRLAKMRRPSRTPCTVAAKSSAQSIKSTYTNEISTRCYRTSRQNTLHERSAQQSSPVSSTMSEASLATSLPDAMAIPTSARFRAGESFTPEGRTSRATE